MNHTQSIVKLYLKPLPPTPHASIPALNPDSNTTKLEVQSAQNSWNVDKSNFPGRTFTKPMIKREQKSESLSIKTDSLTAPEASQLDERLGSVNSEEPVNVYEDVNSLEALQNEFQEESGITDNIMFGESEQIQSSSKSSATASFSIAKRNIKFGTFRRSVAHI